MSGLDRQKLDRLTAARRAAIRGRSYCMVAFYACLGCAAELVWMAVWRIVGLGQIVRPVVYVAAAAGLIWLGMKMLKRARQLQKEARTMPRDPPAAPPDFSTLNDGSQIARDLEDMK